MSDNKSRGVGDTVDKILQKTKIKQIVDRVTDGDCGCNERKEALNKKFPYKNND